MGEEVFYANAGSLICGYGVMLAIVAILLIANMINPNRFYGFRNRRTLGDPEIWYAANHCAGIQLLIAGIFTTIFSIISTSVPDITADFYSLTTVIVFLVVMILVTVRSMRYVHSLDE